MINDLTARYIWMIDTLNRYGRLSREEISNLWRKSNFSDGDPMPARTFYHYRRGIERNFNIDIKCDEYGKYYLEGADELKNKSSTNLMLESYAVGSALVSHPLPPDRVEVEDVPSAREYLPMMLEAIADSQKVIISYSSFARSRTETEILFRPYFMKRYKQRWYVIGLKEKGKEIRTYALDRISAMQFTGEGFDMPPAITTADIFDSIIGVTTSKAPVRIVKLKVTPTQAKYFRALPLHHSQTEEVHDSYSIFSYYLKLNYELTHEILSFGDAVMVLEPPELRLMVTNQLKDTLARYENEK